MGTNRPCLLSCEQLEARLQPAVTYHGGVLLPHVEAQAVYLGSEWNSTQGEAKIQALDGFLSYLVSSPYMDALTRAGYRVGRGVAVPGVVLPNNINKNYYLTDSQIQHDLQNAISAGTIQPPDANRAYVVYTEPGVAVYNNSDGSDSVYDFLGYHGAFGGHNAAGKPVDIHYVVVPYPGGWNPTADSQGFPTNFSEVTSITSHELAETVTDPNVNYKRVGWYDDHYGSEIGDLTGGAIRELNGYYIQLLVNRIDRALVVTGATMPTGVAATGGVGGNGFDAAHVAHIHQHRTPELPPDTHDFNWGVRVG
jgi:hypothetical protein